MDYYFVRFRQWTLAILDALDRISRGLELRKKR